MPNTKTAIKNLRKTQRQTIVNRNISSQLKTTNKKIISLRNKALENKDSYDKFDTDSRELFSSLHSLSRHNSHAKLRASRFESRIKISIKKLEVRS